MLTVENDVSFLSLWLVDTSKCIGSLERSALLLIVPFTCTLGWTWQEQWGTKGLRWPFRENPVQLNLSLTLKGWVALVFKSCSPVHSLPAPRCYSAAGERDARAVSTAGHGEAVHHCHVMLKELHPGQVSFQEGTGTAGVCRLGEGFCNGCVGGVLGLLYPPVSRQARSTLLSLTGSLALSLRDSRGFLKPRDCI